MKILEFNEKPILKGYGKISNEEMEKYVSELYNEFNQKRKLVEANEEDKKEDNEIQQLLNAEMKIKK